MDLENLLTDHTYTGESMPEIDSSIEWVPPESSKARSNPTSNIPTITTNLDTILISEEPMATSTPISTSPPMVHRFKRQRQVSEPQKPHKRAASIPVEQLHSTKSFKHSNDSPSYPPSLGNPNLQRRQQPVSSSKQDSRHNSSTFLSSPNIKTDPLTQQLNNASTKQHSKEFFPTILSPQKSSLPEHPSPNNSRPSSKATHLRNKSSLYAPKSVSPTAKSTISKAKSHERSESQSQFQSQFQSKMQSPSPSQSQSQNGSTYLSNISAVSHGPHIIVHRLSRKEPPSAPQVMKRTPIVELPSHDTSQTSTTYQGAATSNGTNISRKADSRQESLSPHHQTQSETILSYLETFSAVLSNVANSVDRIKKAATSSAQSFIGISRAFVVYIIMATALGIIRFFKFLGHLFFKIPRLLIASFIIGLVFTILSRINIPSESSSLHRSSNPVPAMTSSSNHTYSFSSTSYPQNTAASLHKSLRSHFLENKHKNSLSLFPTNRLNPTISRQTVSQGRSYATLPSFLSSIVAKPSSYVLPIAHVAPVTHMSFLLRLFRAFERQSTPQLPDTLNSVCVTNPDTLFLKRSIPISTASIYDDHLSTNIEDLDTKSHCWSVYGSHVSLNAWFESPVHITEIRLLNNYFGLTIQRLAIDEGCLPKEISIYDSTPRTDTGRSQIAWGSVSAHSHEPYISMKSLYKGPLSGISINVEPATMNQTCLFPIQIIGYHVG